uniref:Uncharacterized protein n=1 Tax=Arundo donax TaxID=35708 RepID=A0A0A9B0R9_ARUDO
MQSSCKKKVINLVLLKVSKYNLPNLLNHGFFILHRKNL